MFPQATEIVATILVDMIEPELAASLLGQRFHGCCDCTPGCRFVLTAPAGSSGPQMLWLEAAGDVVGEVSLDPTGTFVTNLDISDCAAVAIPPDWLSVTVPRPRISVSLIDDRRGLR
ncbi:hypothetical protein Cci01nite_82980 [Catellatospora citrea]|uniref:Uncharacterized protein n=1 Tax=Catellatospora citrea TaxID=53366 RepID=A0A8J3KWG5_9ACTN|nr:hypothetical protein Cci01nite_82980 [Catellatospora citrea]